ncbi:MAG: MFS transporter [Anaerolineales bacterium]|jgi:fucose permease|nr:MFS transporter [Anaerolineales bacterium]
MKNQPLKTTVFLVTAACFLSFFVFGFTDNLKGPTLPSMIRELNIDYGISGNIFFGEYFGFIITSLIAGILADRFGLKVILILAGGLLAAGVAGYSSFSNIFLLTASLFSIGLGLGAIELGANAAIVQIHTQKTGLYLNLMAVLHGLGSLVAPLFAGWLLAMNVTWRTIYRWDIPLIALFVLLFLFLQIPKSQGQSNSIDFRNIPNFAFKGNLPWFYAAIAFYVAAELGVGSWLVTFLQNTRGASVLGSNQSLSLFFALLMLGRLGGGFIVHRLGYLRSILFASIGSLICITIGTFTNFSVFLPITGFFFSIIFPTFTASVSENVKENMNTILGVLYTFAGIGGLLGPWVIAQASDLLGLNLGFAFAVIFTALLTASVSILLKGAKNGQTT